MTDESRKLWEAKDPGLSVHWADACLPAAAHTPGSLVGPQGAWGCPSLPRREGAWGAGRPGFKLPPAPMSHGTWEVLFSLSLFFLH